MTTSTRLFTGLVLVSSSTGACAGFSSDADPETAPEPGSADAGRGPSDGGIPKAPVVNGTPGPGEFIESFGVFSTPGGTAGAPGTRKQPLASIQAGIDLGKSLGKRVYVCGGTFHESLVIADSIAIIGGLDCSGEAWLPGKTRTRVEGPASPAALAKGIVSTTRIENLELIAPMRPTPARALTGSSPSSRRGCRSSARGSRRAMAGRAPMASMESSSSRPER